MILYTCDSDIIYKTQYNNYTLIAAKISYTPYINLISLCSYIR